MVVAYASKHLEDQSYLCRWSQFWAQNLTSADPQFGSRSGSTTLVSTVWVTPFRMELAAYTSTTTQRCCEIIQAKLLLIRYVIQPVGKSKSIHFPLTNLPRKSKKRFSFWSTLQSTWWGTKMSSRRRVNQKVRTNWYHQQDNRWEGHGET